MKIRQKTFRLGKGVYVLNPKDSMIQNIDLVVWGVKRDIKRALSTKLIKQETIRANA